MTANRPWRHAGDGSSDLLFVDANLGFTRAANIGIRRGRSEHVLLLNPDTEVYTETP